MAGLTKEVRDVGRDFNNEGEIEIYRFPEEWTIKEFFLGDMKALGENGIQQCISQEFPYKSGTATLEALAKGKRNAVILVDDLTRPTPAYEMVPHILNLLIKAGIAENQISFIFAVGMHRPMTQKEMGLKIGEDTVRKYKVENHNSFEGDFADLGCTEYGTPVKINRKVVESDLVIALNTIAKHRFVYACGGSKMVLPGVSHKDTILTNHKDMTNVQRKKEHRFGKTRADMDKVAEKLAEKTNLISIDVTINRLKQTTGIYMGSCPNTFNANVEEALKTYAIKLNKEDFADIGFFRMNFHSTDALQMSRCIDDCEKVCDLPIIIANCRDEVYYDGKVDGPFEVFLESLKGKETLPNPPLEHALANRGYGNIIVCSPHLEMKSTHLKNPNIYVANDWDSLIQQLYEHIGANRKIAFFHDASMHILEAI